MAIVGLRNNNAYVGFAKQVSQGTPVAPSTFPRWLDGTSLEMDLTVEDIYEGDTSRRNSFITKKRQMVKLKHVCAPRPIEMGFLEQAALGSGADALGSVLLTTTTASVVTANVSTTVTLASVVGLPGSGTVGMVFEAGTGNEEIVPFTMPASGSVITVAAGYNGATGKFALSHANPVAAKTQSIHVLTDQTVGNYFTIEVSLGGTSGYIVRITDCQLNTIKRSGAPGLLMYETEWLGIASVVKTAATSVTLEAHSPFLWTQGAWTLNNVTTGNALAVEKFDIEQKNNVDIIQTEQLIPAALLFGKVEVDVAIDEVFQDSSLIGQAYFGTALNTTAANAATDAQVIIPGALSLVFTQADSFNAVTYALTTLMISKVGLPVPKVDGKHFTQQLSLVSVSNQGVNTNVLSTTVNNSQYTQY